MAGNMGKTNPSTDQGNRMRCEQCNMDFRNQQELDQHNRQSHNR